MFNTTKRKRPFSVVGGGAAASSKSSSSTKSQLKGKKSSTPPTTIELNGIEVHFPFTPYDVQKDYMESVLTALTNKQHALLESPTGTGKTLCLLCSALAWQRQEKGRLLQQKDGDTPPGLLSSQLSQSVQPIKPHAGAPASTSQLSQLSATTANNLHAPSQPTSSNKPPIIIYASRTHSQLSQVVGELRNTRYRPKHAVLGSREHMCIHPKVNPTVAKGKNKNTTNECKASSTDVNNGCNKLNKDRKCMMRNNLEEATSKGSVWHPPSTERYNAGADYEQPVLDMEDLVTVGIQNKICPFYHTRSLLKEAELIFVPYNYLFDRDARETTLAEVDFNNAILIFDEAHNLEEFASESSSFDLSTSDISGCVGEVQRALQYLELNPEMGNDSSCNKNNMLTLKRILLKFETYLSDDITKSMGASKMSTEGEASYSGESIYDIFEKGAGINFQNLFLLSTFVKQVSDFIMEFRGNTSSSGTPKLDHFLNCLKRAFGKYDEQGPTANNQRKHLLALARSKSYRVHVTKQITGSGGFNGGRTISFWCFAPALAMRELSFLNVRSIIITSGTLSPLPSFQMELGLNFPVQLENNHVIKPDQIFVRVIGKGVSGKELSSKFGRRDDPEYLSELGNTLASLVRNIPGGVLVFFPSYSAMSNAVQRWGGPASQSGRQSGGGGRGAAFFAAKKKKQTSNKCVFPMVPNHFRSSSAVETPWQRLLSRKSIVLEPRSTSELTDAISEYKRLIEMPKSTGAILMGVCRGKISEGIDFSDDMARAVVVTGLPFAPYFDPKVKLKREFLDAARASAKSRPSIDGGFGNGKFNVNKVEMTPASKTLSGSEWYNQQAHRAVNQAIGRVIRHRHDYGSILLLDHRFATQTNKDGLSKWLRGHLRDESFGSSTRGLVQFYRDSKIKADEARAFQEQEKKAKLPEKPNRDLAYNDEPRKAALVDNSVSDASFIPKNKILKTIDATKPTPSKKVSNDIFQSMLDDDSPTLAKKKPPPVAAKGLGGLYGSKDKARPQPKHPSMVSTTNTQQTSSFGDIRKPRADSVKVVKREPIKRRPQPGRKNSDASVQMAKKFFEQAQIALSSQDLNKVRSLLVTMKNHGNNKNEAQYVKAAKELIMVLTDGQVDGRRVQLIGSLFPLLPMKYRYKIEKMASILAWQKSVLQSQCKDALSTDEMSTVKSFILPMIFNNDSSSNDPTADRALLEDAQKVLSILRNHAIQLQLFYDLLPERHRRRVRPLVLEMDRTRDVVKAKERASNYKGEKMINTALFHAASKPALRVSVKTEDPDTESQKELSLAISQAMEVNLQKKNRINNFQNNSKPKAQPSNPYQRTGLKEFTNKRQVNGNDNTSLSSKRVRSGSNINSTKSMDMVDKCLHQANSGAYVSRQDRIRNIKANVPKQHKCDICQETQKEPLLAECGHSACALCWKNWLNKSNTCHKCRAITTMGSLSKMVFTKKTATGTVPTLTQICAEEGDDESDDEGLEFISTM